MSLVDITSGSSYISATVNGTSGVPYYISNGNETTELLTGETVHFYNLDPSTEYPFDYKKRLQNG